MRFGIITLCIIEPSLDLPVKLYFDIEYEHSANKEMNAQVLVKDLIDIFIVYCNRTYGILCLSKDVIILVSSTDVKVSYHLIFKTVVFANNKNCKDFIHHVLESLSPEHLERFFVNDIKKKRKLIIDMSVYNRNQNFRIIYSSKFGKNTPLKLVQNNIIDLDQSMSTFFDTLICDKSLLVNTHNNKSNHNVNTSVVNKIKHNEVKNGIASLISNWPVIDVFVKSCIGSGEIMKTLTYENKENTSKKMILYTIKKYNYCENIKRAHKSNTIYYIADVQRMCIYQKCNKCVGFRGKDILMNL